MGDNNKSYIPSITFTVVPLFSERFADGHDTGRKVDAMEFACDKIITSDFKIKFIYFFMDRHVLINCI